MKEKILVVIIPEKGPIVSYHGLDEISSNDLQEITRALTSVIYSRAKESRSTSSSKTPQDIPLYAFTIGSAKYYHEVENERRTKCGLAISVMAQSDKKPDNRFLCESCERSKQ